MPTPCLTWGETRRRLGEDEARIRDMLRARFGVEPVLLLFDPSWRCVALHRAAHCLWRRGARKSARLLVQLNSVLTGADIHPNCDFGGGLLIPHPAALTASGNAGRNLTMMPLSGIGMLPRPEDVGAGPGLPVLGDDVWLGAGCGVLGPVRVGDGTRLQPGASLTRDVPRDSLVEMAARPVPGGPRVSGGGLPVTRPACGHGRWAVVRADLAADIDRYLAVREPGAGAAPGALRRLGAALSTEVLGVAIYRVSHGLHVAGWRRLAAIVAAANAFLHRLTISPESCLGGGLFLPHPAGTVIDAAAGRDLTLYARTLCAAGATGGPAGPGPVIGERVVIAGMAAVLGAVSVGDDSRVGFNVQLRQDVPPGHSAGSPVMRTRVGSLPAAPEEVPAERPVSPVGYADTLALLRADLARLRAGAGGRVPLPARLCVTGFRHARFFAGRGRRRLARWCWWWTTRLTGADIDPRSDIGPGLVVAHPAGISVHATAGRDLTVGALAVIGPQDASRPLAWGTASRPVLGEGVVVGEHAAVHGAVRVGDRARIGAGCKVTADVAAGAALEMPAPRLRRASAGQAGEEP